MTPTRHQPTRPRAIAVPAGTAFAPRLAWTLATVAALLLVLTVRAAVGGAPTRVAAVADAVLPYPLDTALAHLAHQAPAAGGQLNEFHAIPHRATLRTPDRSRRTAGRAGVSVRRDLGHASAVLPANAAAPRILEGGSAPFGAHVAAIPPARDTAAHGVRGPPSFSFVAG